MEIAGKVFAMSICYNQQVLVLTIRYFNSFLIIFQFERFNPCDLETPISPFYVIYRFVHLCWYIISYALNYTCYDKAWIYYAIYLTHQTLFLQALYSLLSFIYIFGKLWTTALTPAHVRASQETVTFNVENNRLPFLTKIIWILMNIIYTVPFIISMIYWFILHDCNLNLNAILN